MWEAVVVVTVVAVVNVAHEDFAAYGSWLLHWPPGQRLVGQPGWHLSCRLPVKEN